MNTCWWDYRGIHPARRTQLFANTYRRMYQRFYAKYYDASKADMVSGLAGRDDIFDVEDTNERRAKAKRTTLTGLWRARQSADELGISYSIYIAAIFERACMNWSNMATSSHLRLPRPVQMYSDKARMAALDEQAKEIERYIPDFRNPTLKLGSKAPHKADFDQWLFELGKLRRYHKEMAFNRMVEQGYICMQTASKWTSLARD